MLNEPLSAPEPLSDLHRLEQFSCGEASLDLWLRQRARGNEASGASRTYVVCDTGMEVKAYYSLSACSIAHAFSTASMRRNMPDPIPMLLLGRLAVDRGLQGSGVGSSLLRDAVIRAEQTAVDVGVRGLWRMRFQRKQSGSMLGGTSASRPLIQ